MFQTLNGILSFKTKGVVMKAIVCTKYGNPDVLQLMNVKKPIPKDDEVLVKIHAVSLNAADLEYLKGMPFIRIASPFRPLNKILGSDIAGVVERVGKNIRMFKPGDAVIGDLFDSGMGGFARYVCTPEKTLIKKPQNMSFEDAATLPQAAIIALQGIRSKREMTKGQKVLINGAGGGMGTFAIQLAKYFGAEVTGVDSAEKFAIMKKLGADFVINYKEDDFTKNGQQYDLILDIAAYHPIEDSVKAMKDDGIYLFVGGKTSLVLKTALGAKKFKKGTNKKIGLLMWKQYIKDDFDFLIELIYEKKLVPIIDKRYNLSEVQDALWYMEKGHAKGKVIINTM